MTKGVVFLHGKQNSIFPSEDLNEMIGKIEHIGIEDSSATGWNITIILTSVAGETNQYSFNI